MLKRRHLFSIVLLVLLAAIAWAYIFSLADPDQYQVRFLDVGQGDAALISQGDIQLLIDAGPDSRILEKLGKYMPFYDHTIELVIFTHPDLDHIGGMRWVLERYRVERALITGAFQNNQAYSRILQLLDDKKVRIRLAATGTEIKIGSNAALFVLSPQEPLLGKRLSDSNEGSIVAKLFIGKHTFLFTGDAERSVEVPLVRSGINLSSEVLKVSHHGARRGTTRLFLSAVKPRMAVISVGKNNPYGHPSSQVLNNLGNITAYRTDCQGDIVFEIRAEKMFAKTERRDCQ